MGGLLERLGRTAARRHRIVLGAWLAAAVAVVVLAVGSGGRTFDDFTIPGAQSQRALDLLEERFPAESGASATVVFHARSGTLAEPAADAAIEAAVKRLGQVTDDPTVSPTLTSKDGTTAVVALQYSQTAPQVGVEGFRSVERAAAPARSDGVDVAFGGPLTDYAEASHSSASDLVGLLFAVVVLVFAFGSLVAAALPIGTALLGLGVGISGILLLASVTDVGSAAPELGSMIGLGVGIDYSLFIVTRHRENAATGMSLEDAAGRAVATAGQAVLFAGTTVVIALCGLAVAGIPYVTILGFTAALVVAVMIVAALTLVPALLGLLGPRIERGRVLGRHREGASGSAAGASASPFWERWATHVTRHPWPFAVASVALLVTLALPFAWIRYGEADDGTAPAGSTQRIAFDRVAEAFGTGANGPLLVVVTFPKGQEVPAALTTALGDTPGVSAVAPAEVNPAGDTAVLEVVPTTAPDAEATTELVDHLRDDVIPDALRGGDAQAFVGGITAAYIDMGNQIASRLPLFIAAVVLLSFLLLMIVFRSVLIPATAGLMNLLSVGAAYGVTVAVFQWGWLKGALGLAGTIPIISFVPMMMFAVLFGLSMDYQVFLLTRVREEYDRQHDTRTAVVTAVSHTARVITSAALIMIVVFLSFVAAPIPEIKMFGLGLAVAVAVDSTIVRMVLVPSLMSILGRANWWFPSFLQRLLPRIEID